MPTENVWLITGSSRGIGLELAKQLLEQPSNTVIATARDPANATKLNALKSSAKGTLHILQLDVADRESIRKCADEVAGILGDKGIDYLVNNAAIMITDGHKDTAYAMDIDILERTFKTNVAGPAYIAQVLLPLVRKSAKKTIVNVSSTISSMAWEAGGDRHASYSICKAGLNMLTVKQAREIPEITSVAICPGWLKTELGGEGAMYPVSTGVAGVLKVVGGLTPANSGQFYNFEGERLAW